MFMLYDNLPLQVVNLCNFTLCHLHYQSPGFNDVILVHKVFLHYLSTVLPFPVSLQNPIILNSFIDPNIIM